MNPTVLDPCCGSRMMWFDKQAQQSKPAKPTVGQIMAAKRAKKREQEIERLAKAKIGNKSIDRNKASELEFIQYKNRKAMCEGEPPNSGFLMDI